MSKCKLSMQICSVLTLRHTFRERKNLKWLTKNVRFYLYVARHSEGNLNEWPAFETEILNSALTILIMHQSDRGDSGAFRQIRVFNILPHIPKYTGKFGVVRLNALHPIYFQKALWKIHPCMFCFLWRISDFSNHPITPSFLTIDWSLHFRGCIERSLLPFQVNSLLLLAVQIGQPDVIWHTNTVGRVRVGVHGLGQHLWMNTDSDALRWICTRTWLGQWVTT